MSTYKLNLSTVLKHLDQGNLKLYKDLQARDEERVEFERMLSVVVPLWMCGADDDTIHANLIHRFNVLGNFGWFLFAKSPELRAKILASVGLGESVKHAYIPSPKGITTGWLLAFLRGRYFDLRKDDVVRWCKQNTETVLQALLLADGLRGDETKKIIEEYRSILAGAA